MRKNWTDNKLYDRLLNNKSKVTYWDNIRELHHRPSEYVYNRAIELCKSGNEKHIKIGIDILAQLGVNKRFKSKKVVKLACGILENDHSKNVYESALYCIGHNNDKLLKSDIDKAIKFRTHQSSDLRFALVHALFTLKQKNAIKTQIDLTFDKHKEVRNWATFSLALTENSSEEKNIIKTLFEKTKDTYSEVRYEALHGLSKRKIDGVKELIINELKNPNCDSMVFECASELGDKDLIPFLEELFYNNLNDESINEDWLTDLQRSIEILKI